MTVYKKSLFLWQSILLYVFRNISTECQHHVQAGYWLFLDFQHQHKKIIINVLNVSEKKVIGTNVCFFFLFIAHKNVLKNNQVL